MPLYICILWHEYKSLWPIAGPSCSQYPFELCDPAIHWKRAVLTPWCFAEVPPLQPPFAGLTVPQTVLSPTLGQQVKFKSKLFHAYIHHGSQYLAQQNWELQLSLFNWKRLSSWEWLDWFVELQLNSLLLQNSNVLSPDPIYIILIGEPLRTLILF